MIVPAYDTLPTSRQIRAARALLGWSIHEMANETGISYPTLQKVCRANDRMPCFEATARIITVTLESKGVKFVPGGVALVPQA